MTRHASRCTKRPRPALRVALTLACVASVVSSALGAQAQDDAHAQRSSSASGAVAPSKPPNLLVILLDDWGIDRFDGFPTQPDTSARTPELDAFAADNLLFTRAYADPECSPSRAALITGELGLHTGVRSVFTFYAPAPSDFVLDPDAHASLPAALGELGYATFLVGKWHLTNPSFQPDPYMHPIAMGFERHVGVIANLNPARGHSYRSYELVRADAAGVVKEDVVDGTYITTRQIDDALQLIESADAGRPWFTLLALTAPHRPWERPPAELIDGDPQDLDLDDDVALYDAVLEAADTEIGRLLRSIDPSTLANTVVLVMGDNGTPGIAFDGYPEVNAKKGFATDGGTHVPLIVAAPGLAAGHEDQLVHIVDLHATLLELAGGKALTDDSVSFASRLRPAEERTQPAVEREWVYAARCLPIGTSSAQAKVFRRLLRNDKWLLQADSLEPGQLHTELRALDGALWGEGSATDWEDREVRRAKRALLALLDEIESSE